MAKILLIEDFDPLREELLDWLTLEGYEAIGADNGRTGIDAALHHLPDLILSDIMLPDLDGYAVFHEVRAIPRLAHIPFIFLSAHAMAEDIDKGLLSGADAYITKPFTRNDLFMKIQGVLSRAD